MTADQFIIGCFIVAALLAVRGEDRRLGGSATRED